MGVSGCGKSTVGELLGGQIKAEFLDGDSLHPKANIDKMASEKPLDDADREPWLGEIGRLLAAAGEREPLIIACSALKRKYRNQIREQAPATVFIHLHGSLELLTVRMGERAGHFMPVGLLKSQFETLEDLEPDERGLVLDISASPQQLTSQAASWLGNH